MPKLHEDDPSSQRELNPRALHSSKLTIHEACSCTTAAPTYFKSVRIRGRQYIDGGVWANNPAVEAWNEARLMTTTGAGPKLLLSIGTGRQKEQSRFGLLRLAKFAFRHIASTTGPDQEARGLFNNDSDTKYFRFTVPADARHKGLHKIRLAECKKKRRRQRAQDEANDPGWPAQVYEARRDDELLRAEAVSEAAASAEGSSSGFAPDDYTYTTFDKLRDRTIAYLYTGPPRNSSHFSVPDSMLECAQLLWDRSSRRREANSQRWNDFRNHPGPTST